jgi:hypothetical protein
MARLVMRIAKVCVARIASGRPLRAIPRCEQSRGILPPPGLDRRHQSSPGAPAKFASHSRSTGTFHFGHSSPSVTRLGSAKQRGQGPARD